MEAPRLMRDLPMLGWWPLIGGLRISLTVMLLRIAWVFPGAYLPLLVLRKQREREGGLPTWRPVLLVGWCGMRGVVSLAAALDGIKREMADKRLEVSHDVRVAVHEAQSAELLRLRDGAEINDRIFIELQLEIDRKGLAM